MRLVWVLLIGAACGVLPHAAIAQAVDPIEGLIVREIRISGLQHLSPDVVERHLATRAGAPFRRTLLATDQRRLDELRLFTAVESTPDSRTTAWCCSRVDGDAATAACGHHPGDRRKRPQCRAGPARSQPPRRRNTDGCGRPVWRRDGCERRRSIGRRSRRAPGPASRVQLFEPAEPAVRLRRARHVRGRAAVAQLDARPEHRRHWPMS